PLQAHVSTSNSPFTSGFDDLDVVHTNDPLAIHVDEPFIHHITGEQHLTVTTYKWSQVQNVRIQTNALLIEISHSPARHKEITTPVSRNDTCDRCMIVASKADDHVLDGGHTFT